MNNSKRNSFKRNSNLGSINTFVDKLQTLTSKAMEDTLTTIKIYENARFEYDAYRYDYEVLLSRNQTNEDIERQYQQSKERYEKSKHDVTVKLKLLDENRVRYSYTSSFK